MSENQLYAWRQKQRLESLTTEEEKLQRAELARLKREVERLQEESALLKKRRRRTSPGDRSEVGHDSRP